MFPANDKGDFGLLRGCWSILFATSSLLMTNSAGENKSPQQKQKSTSSSAGLMRVFVGTDMGVVVIDL
jgi:hypothetical protein